MDAIELCDTSQNCSPHIAIRIAPNPSTAWSAQSIANFYSFDSPVSLSGESHTHTTDIVPAHFPLKINDGQLATRRILFTDGSWIFMTNGS